MNQKKYKIKYLNTINQLGGVDYQLCSQYQDQTEFNTCMRMQIMQQTQVPQSFSESTRYNINDNIDDRDRILEDNKTQYLSIHAVRGLIDQITKDIDGITEKLDKITEELQSMENLQELDDTRNRTEMGVDMEDPRMMGGPIMPRGLNMFRNFGRGWLY